MTTMAQLIIEVESRGLKRSNDSLQDLTQKADKAERKTKKLGDQSDKTSTQQKRLGDQSGKTGGMFDKQSRSSGGLISKLSKLETVVFGAAAAFASINVIGIADEMRTLDNIVGTVTDSERERVAVQKQLLGIANQNYAQLGATTELYVANRRALSELGKTQQQTLDFTDNLSKTFLIGGAAAESQAGAVRQLGQALASGALRGDEFNSIAENAPIILGLVAEELGVARGALRDMAADGAITSEVIFNAVSGSTELLSQMADDMDTTIKQAFTRASNNAKSYLGNLVNSTTGVTGQIAKAINFVGDNLETFANVGLAGVAIAAVSMASSVNVAAVAVKALGVVVATNPLFLAGAVLAAIAVKVYGVQGAMDELGKAISITGEIAGDVLGLITTGYAALWDLVKAVYGNMTQSAASSAEQSTGFFGEFFADSGTGFQGLLIKAARVFDAIGGFAMGMAIYAGERVAWFVSNAGNAFTSLGNFAKGVFEGVVNTVVEAINLGAQKINELITMANNASSRIPILGQKMQVGMLGQLDEISLGRGTLQSMPEVSLSGSIDAGFAKQGGALEQYARSLGSATQASADLTTVTDTAIGSVGDLADAKDKAAGATKKLKDETGELTGYLKDLDGQVKRASDDMIARLELTEQIRRDYDERYRIEKEHIDRVNAIRGTALSEAQKAAMISVSSDRMGAQIGDARRPFTDLMQQAGGPNPQGDLDSARLTQIDQQDELRRQNLINEQEHADAMLAIERNYQDAKNQLALTGGQAYLSSIGSILGLVAGEHSSAYRGMFALQKAVDFASAQSSSLTAIADAWKTGGTFSQKAIAAAKVAASTGVIPAAIQAITPTGFKSGGYTGNGGVSEIAGVVHGKEYVVNAPNTARYRPQLEAMNRGTFKEGGSEGGTKAGDNININVTINSDGSASAESAKEAGVKMGQIIKTAVQTELRKQTRQGGMLATV